MSDNQRIIAVFDFDGTLIEGDSFFPYLAFVTSWPRTLFVFITAFLLLVLRTVQNRCDPAIPDARTFLKVQLLERLLKGKSLAQSQTALPRLMAWKKWKNDICQKLFDHHAQGHEIVIASGGLDLYLDELLKDIPHNALICTQVGIESGIITGVMTNGNCVRDRKAELVAAYIEGHGPYDDSYGYGNFPHDVPMLNLLKHRVLV